jgi:hypothetical protein
LHTSPALAHSVLHDVPRWLSRHEGDGGGAGGRGGGSGKGGKGGEGGDNGGDGGEGGGVGITSKPARTEIQAIHDSGTMRTYRACIGALKMALTRVLRSLFPWNVAPLSTSVYVLPSTLTCT